MKIKKKIISLILTLAMCISIIPLSYVSVHAVETIKESGTCGENLTWKLDNNGTLTISGTGEMLDWEDDEETPWDNKDVKSVIIEEGVTSIGEWAFGHCKYLKNVSISNSVTSIGSCVFYMCSRLANVSLPDNLTNIGALVFYDTPLYDNSNNWENGAFYLGHYLIDAKNISGDYKIKEGTTVVAKQAFSSNKNVVTSVTLPNSIITFYQTYLKTDELTIPSSILANVQWDENSCLKLKTLNIIDMNDNKKLTDQMSPSVLCSILHSDIEQVNYKKPALSYNMVDNVEGVVHYANSHVINVDSVEYNTYSNVIKDNTFSKTDKLQETKNPEGKIFAFYGDKDSITVVPEDSNKEQIKIENEGFNFGAATIGDDGCYYILWGKDISDDSINSAMDEENIQICKYDSSGKLIKTLGLPVSYTKAQFPFSYGNAAMSYNNDFLCIFYSTRWTVKPSDGLHHQGSSSIRINTRTMELIGFNKQEVSHEFGIAMIPTDYGFAAIQRGDAGPRGISMTTYHIIDNKTVRGAANKVLYHSSGQYGTNAHYLDGNETYIYMGGLAVSNSTYAIAGKSERIYTSDVYKDSKLGNGIYDVFVRIVDFNIVNSNHSEFAGTIRIDQATGEDADYNVIWLTECNKKEKAVNVKIVTLLDGSYCVLWEKQVDGKFDSIRYVILDECGHTLRRETAIYNARLSCTSIQPIVQENMLIWAVANKKDKTITWYSVDLGKLEQYDESKIQTKQSLNSGSSNKVTNSKYETEKIGQIFYYGAENYGVVNTKEVQFMGLRGKDVFSSWIISSKVKINGNIYKVTSIGDDALKERNKLKKISIGANIKYIGKKAFMNCKNLKKIVIKSSKLTLENIGDDAFKGINSNVIIKVPKSKLSLYIEILKEKGVTDTAIVKAS